MATAARSRGLRKATRDILQALVAVVGAGGAYALIELIVGTVHPSLGVILAFVFKILVTYAQNSMETRGTIPVFLPTPGVVTDGVHTTEQVVGTAVATVDSTVEETGELVGEVVSTAGRAAGTVVGTVTGNVGGLLGDD